MSGTIPHILIPADTVTLDEYAPIEWLGGFCRELVESGPFEWSDLPPAARAFFALDIYSGNVSNGGHMQWLQNRRYDEAEVAACRAGLAMLPPSPFQPIFEEAAATIESDPSLRDRFRADDIRGWSEDERKRVETKFAEFDRLFLGEAGGSGALAGLMRRALLASPETRLVESGWRDEVRALVLAGRKAKSASGELDEAERKREGMRSVLLQLVDRCLRDAGRRLEGDLKGYVSAQIVRKQPVIGFRVPTDKGRCLMLLLADGVALWDLAQDKAICGVRVPSGFRSRDFNGLPL